MTENIVMSDVLTAGSPSRNITSEECKSLVISSSSSDSAPGAKKKSMLLTGVGKECSDEIWYYLFLRRRELKRYIEIFTGQKKLLIKETGREETFGFKVFSYTTADHNRRFNQCTYTKEEYNKRKDAALKSKEAFREDKADVLNSLVDKDEVSGDGYLFVCAPLDDLKHIFNNMLPRQYLVCDKRTFRPAEILGREMEEFIYLYESMPYKIELMEHPLEDYTIRQKKIRITSGIFAGKVGRLMRLHKSHKLVFAFGNMTIAISYIHAFPFEEIE